MRASLMRRSCPITLALALSLLPACAVPDVDLVATIELGPPLLLEPQGVTGPAVPSIGIIDGHLLTLWNENRAISRRLGFDVVGQWFTPDGERMGDRFFLGHSTGIRLRMAESDGALHFAFVGNGPEDDPNERDDSRLLRVVQARPDEAPTMREVAIDLAPRTVATRTIGGQGWRGGVPALTTTAGVVMMVEANPNVDGCWDGCNRGFVLTPDATRADYARWGTAVRTENDASRFALVHTSRSTVGWFFRTQSEGLSVKYAQLDPANLPVATQPVVVGGDPTASPVSGIRQLFAAYAGDARIIMAHQATDTRYPLTTCWALRTLNDDGSDAHDAPWQLPCLREGMDRWVSPLVDLEETSHGALLAWGERSGPRNVGFGTDPVATVRLRVALVASDGTRGSEIIDIVRHDNALPVDYLPMLAVDGEDIVVAYFDPLADPPGLYARRVVLTDIVR